MSRDLGIGLRRAGAVLLVIFTASAGLWHCGEETTRSQTGALNLALRAPVGPGAETIELDSLEVVVLRRARVAACDTVVPDSAGAFATEFALEAEGAYTVRVYAYGEGGDRWPDESRDAGVVAYGEGVGVEIRPGRLTEACIVLDPAFSSVLGVEGWEGVPEIHAWWSAAPGASAYTLAWYALSGGEVQFAPAVTDTQMTLVWPGGTLRAALADGSDSVLFRVRSHYDSRAGVFGPGRWEDLARWLDLPRLLAHSPAAGETVAVESAVVVLEFDRAMETASISGGVLWTRDGGGSEVPFAVEAQAMETRFRLTALPGVLAMGADYRLSITTEVRDLTGRRFDADSLAPGRQDSTLHWHTAPYRPLHVLAMDPVLGEMDVARNRTVRVAFDRSLDPTSVGPAAIYLVDSWGDTLSGTLQLSLSRDTVSWQPQEACWFSTACTLHATAALRDSAGGALDQDPATEPPLREPFVAWFQTLAQPEGPRVVAVEPADGVVAVSRDAIVEATLTEAVDPASARVASVRLLRDGSVGIPGAIAVDPGGTRITFTPSGSLESGREYAVLLRGELSGGESGITDFEGHRLDQDREARGYQPFQSTFRVEAPLGVTHLAFSPAGPDTFVDVAAGVALTFSDTLDPAGATAAHIGISRSGIPIAIDLAVDATLPGVRITPDALLDCLGHYRLWVDTLVVADDGSLFDADPLQPGRQRYAFSFTAEPESLHPRVIDIAPGSGESAARVTDSVLVTFSSVVDPATITDESFVLTALEGAGRAGVVPATIMADSLSAWLVPDDSLAYATDYEVTISTVVTGAHGLYALDQDPEAEELQGFTSLFTTDRERTPPHIVAAVPDAGATEVARATAIDLTFSEPVVPTSVEGAFALLAADSAVAGSGSLDGNGRQWTFVPADTLAYATTYTVVVDTTAQDLWGNALDQDPATTLPDPFRIEFLTEQERVPPQVLESDPAAGDSGVVVSTAVELAFSEPLAPASVTAEALRVTMAGAPVAGSLSLGDGDSLITWVPAGAPEESLAYGTTYCVIADTLLTDRAGNFLDQVPATPEREPYSFCFTTEIERVAPTVQAFLPGLSNVPVEAHPQVVFSEPMDPVSLEPEGVVTLVLAGSIPVDFTHLLSVSGDTLTLVPDAWLLPEGHYTVRIDTLATDLAGNGLDGDTLFAGRQLYAETFIVEEDVTGPEVLWVSPADGATHVAPDTLVTVTFSERLLAGTVGSSTVYLLPPSGPAIPLAGDGEPELDSSLTVVTLQPADSLEEGTTYSINVTTVVTDLSRNPLQEPSTTNFTVNRTPLIVWEGGLCAGGASATVACDAMPARTPPAATESTTMGMERSTRARGPAGVMSPIRSS